MAKPKFIPLIDFKKYSTSEMLKRSVEFCSDLKKRRTVRDFSDAAVPREVIENCIKAAGSAPSGANLQPWHFVVVSNPVLKKKIRIAAEEEEKEFYSKRAPEEWLETLKPLGTDSNKPFLETAPFLIAIFYKSYDPLPDGRHIKQYYAMESTGIATGMLITAIHNAGLASLTHTPSPMNFLNDILDRPKNERPFLLLVVGYPSNEVKVPDIKKKKLEEISSFFE
ncbi:MAG: nitroreductase family protein [Ignavibacteria bacterium]|nr:nitroreductase family protein [Ignavibacteria bacterium]MBT8381578.1 nitroreductase family protein [Ignavibacteria bacterium]MBT8391968.1 nitroreductase family protein [Ignavibacteria bacterium]NNJ53172.1 nitroreductase family protein [Ignavibacteriaceae bacterium]NNL21029.1 nitroreductase family protein [Ignavibacteriaceae bacterium]